MPQYLAALTIVLLMGTVVARVLLLRRTGTRAMHFGKLDKTDFLIPPVALFYFYTLFATAFGWPLAITDRFFRSTAVAWVGVGLCLGGGSVLAFSLVSFGSSFRVRIDAQPPGGWARTGLWRVTRNPIYVGFFLFLLGQFLAFPSWTTLTALGFAGALF